ncbi:Hypothetical predicted protein [Paramuricea clavata]|uniref:Reverse transcriptase domain-containing protein n=1 Tax=Paramuricea clavata TaxID=317549 RepID=A0A6S7II24_PARCT|nr:Hypothetical predicted protein [Paramuricea clavata]
MGDFNIDLLVNNTFSKSWLHLNENFQPHQLINEPTRVTLNSATLVDHAFTSLSAKVRAVKVPKIGLSDHYPTCVVFKDGFGSKHCHTSIKYRSFKYFDHNLFVGIIDKHLPMKTKRVKRVEQLDWITQDILNCMRQRDRHKSAKNFAEYKILHNKCVSLVREAKKTYYQSCIRNCKGDSTKLWKYINELVPNNSKSAPTAIKDGETTLTDAKDLCESFNNYFSTVVYKYLPTSNLDPDLEQLNDFVSSKITDDILLTIPPLTCDEVLQSLNQLDPHKATSLDGLSSKILKMSASVIAEPLTLILNQSITYGYFPMRWKTARVAPVHKSGSCTEKSNYRPISILCIVNKLLERHYHNSITTHLILFDLLYKGQSGFRRYHSCESAIVKLVDTWLTNIEHGKLNGVTLIDFRKAFDMVNIDILISKLKCYYYN